MANISKMKLPDNTTYDLKDAHAGYFLATLNDTTLKLRNAAGTNISSVGLVDEIAIDHIERANHPEDDYFKAILKKSNSEYGISAVVPSMWNQFTFLRDQQVVNSSGKTLFVPGKRMSIAGEGFVSEISYFTQGLPIVVSGLTYSNLMYQGGNTAAMYMGSNSNVFEKIQNLLSINSYSDFRITGIDSASKTFELSLSGASGALFNNISPAGALTMPVTLTFTPKVFPNIPASTSGSNGMFGFQTYIRQGIPQFINWYLDTVDSDVTVTLAFANGHIGSSIAPISLSVKTLDSSNNWVNVTLNNLVADDDSYTVNTGTSVMQNVRRQSYVAASGSGLYPAQIYVNGNLVDTVLCQKFWT